MDGSKNLDEQNYVDLEFSRTESSRKQDKIIEFWKYFDSEEILKPCSGSTYTESEQPESMFSSMSLSTSSDISTSSKLSSFRPKPNITKVTKEKKHGDKSCKLEKYMREDLKYADATEVSFDDIKAEIDEFQNRLKKFNYKNKKCDCSKEKIK